MLIDNLALYEDKYYVRVNEEGDGGTTKRTFMKDPEDTKSTMHEKIKLAYIYCNEEDEEEYYKYYIRYNRDVYTFEFEDFLHIDDTSHEYYGQIRTVEGSLERVSTVKGNLGKYVEYAGNTWIVLKEDASEVELITANVMENKITLRGKDSYNNAVEILVNECKKLCKDKYGIEVGGDVLSIRSVGGPEIDATKNTDTVDITKLTKFNPIEEFPYEDFAGTTEEKGFKIADDNYLDDYYQMKKLGILVVPGEYEHSYWCASRFIYEASDMVSFEIVCISGTYEIYELEGCEYEFDEHPSVWTYYIDYDGFRNRKGWERAIRPVIKLTSGILNNTTATGTIDDPIILD